MNFSPEFSSSQKENLQTGKEEIAEKMKILIYKTDPEYFDLLDFDDAGIFLDPALFALFSSRKKDDVELLRQLLYASIDVTQRPKHIKVQSDKYGTIYLPRLGWIAQIPPSQIFELSHEDDNYFLNGARVQIEPLPKNNKGHIELIKYPLEILDDRFYDTLRAPIIPHITDPFKAFEQVFNKSIDLIFDHTPWLSELIQECCFKSLLFDDGTDPQQALFCKRNSFASYRVKGMSFHNIYQPWYDEVFFTDDIARQMGHIVFYTITNNRNRFYQINPESIISSETGFVKQINLLDDRSYQTLFQSLYTSFITLNVLDTFISKSIFGNQQHIEAKGRLAFYLYKALHDLQLHVNAEGKDISAHIYTPDGLYMYENIRQSISDMGTKYQSLLQACRWENQSYNYNHQKFLLANKMPAEMSSP